ncbi:hypothetical protein X798_06687 [Onchocerca flexuosa]|uniref:Uncharacterized protein n=1 Tax=Onchocerca flexuosa TaxID=387005 RepID=A0A238BN72_9BILA|nr:hypothetical protein X798_06687 [Onchocerca flexuosa]
MTMLLLQRLEVDTNIDSWITNWRYAIESLNDILILSESALSNRLSNDRQILELVDSFLDIFPKYFVFDFVLNDEISDEKAKTNETKSSDPLICMKPPQLSANKQEMESFDTAQNVSGSKTMNNAQKDLKAKFDVEAFLKGRKEEVQIKDKPLFTETFDVPHSEKVALRPTYERYRYVEATSEYDLYDDEYDDTYDIQHQNCDLDLSDDDIAFMKAGIEPNINHVPVNDEVNNDTENEKEKEIREVSTRRKKHLKNDRKMMNANVPDEKNRNNACPVQGFRKKTEKMESPSGNNSNERQKPGYTGGRDRQLKERHKGEFRRRQADKKMRSGMF